MALTLEQRRALWNGDGSPATGHRIVSARAGTGKTTVLAEYCIDIVRTWMLAYKPWQGMAVISYTNVAKDELEVQIQKYGHGSALLSSPHFVGTIDAFINQYLFLPFGAAHMGCTARPKLVAEPYGQWHASDALRKARTDDAYHPVFFDCYSLTANGDPILVDKSNRKVSPSMERPAEKPTDSNTHKIRNLKRYVWSHGFATQNDANYLAYVALMGSAVLTQSFIRRFPILVVDEAQDMTEVQHALIDHLRAAGQPHMVLVGDEYQAIYEWNTARPKLFTEKKAGESWSSQTIRNTFRCSPAICTVLANMAADGLVIGPADEGKNKNYDEPVQVREYDKADERSNVLSAIDDLAKLLADRGPHHSRSDTRTVAVLARSGAQVAVLRGYLTGEEVQQARPVRWENRYTKDYLRVVFQVARGDMYAAAGAYEALLLNLSEHDTKADLRADLARAWSAEGANSTRYRALLFEDIKAICQGFSGTGDALISQCHGACKVSLRGVPPEILIKIAKDCRSFAGGQKRTQDQPLSALFRAKEDRLEFQHPTFPNVRLVFSTVHGTKGETYDGVIFFTKENSDPCGCRSSSSNRWSRILHHNLVECENKRIAYVALSRAAQVLCILAPQRSANVWRALL
jgi:superfamily I DNA/RNA helicase